MAYRLMRVAFILPPILLGGCVMQADYDKLQSEKLQLQQEVSTQGAQIETDKAQIARLEGAIKYTIDSDLLFPSGGYQISPEGQKIIAGFAAKLAPTLQTKIVVTGFTDNAKIGRALVRHGITSNDALSQKRAESVMQYMVSEGVKPDLIEARGLGENDPVAANATAAGRAQNRRVELTLVPTA